MSAKTTMSPCMKYWPLFTLLVMGLSGCLGQGERDTAAIETMRQTCTAAVKDRIPSATDETVFIEDGGFSEDDLQVLQWRMSTATVSGRCLFDEAGKFVEFIRQ